MSPCVCFKQELKWKQHYLPLVLPSSLYYLHLPFSTDNEICQRRVLLEKLEKPFPSGIKVWSNFVQCKKKLIEKLEIPVLFPFPNQPTCKNLGQVSHRLILISFPGFSTVLNWNEKSLANMNVVEKLTFNEKWLKSWKLTTFTTCQNLVKMIHDV